MSRRFVLMLISAVVCSATGYGVAVGISKIRIHEPTEARTSMKGHDSVRTNAIIAQKYGGSDPHGDDPHGDDPHDEQHDPQLPANQARSTGKAPRDVYGGDIPNSQQPY
jgi:hypothetical protein